jgi:5-(carboxyamino)imidazole ribonucleotide synthase
MSKFYDLCENTHHQGTLNCTENKRFDSVYAQAKEYLTEIMTQLNYVGVCTLELFEVNQCLLANELAPRVHNSGHWTIEGAVTSQFENHLRAILNLPLGDVKSYGPFLMRNLLSKIPSKIKLLAENGLKLHDYIKTPQKGRKLGHVTVSQSTHPRTAQEVKSMAMN